MPPVSLPLPVLAAPVSVASVDWQPRQGALGEIAQGADDVAQCIRTLLNTPKGSVPLAPDFGSDVHQYLDWPINVARPQLVRAVVEAIGAYEPRAEVTRVVVSVGDVGDPASGALLVEVECRLVGTSSAFVVSTSIPAAS